jgi:hypothetical protein
MLSCLQGSLQWNLTDLHLVSLQTCFGLNIMSPQVRYTFLTTQPSSYDVNIFPAFWHVIYHAIYMENPTQKKKIKISEDDWL